MEFLLSIILAVVGAILSAVFGWGVSLLKRRLGLSPELIQTLDKWEERIVDWILSKAEDAGADLSIPETRWEWVNKGIDAFIGYMPMILDAVGYSKEDLAKEIERYIKDQAKELTSD